MLQVSLEGEYFSTEDKICLLPSRPPLTYNSPATTQTPNEWRAMNIGAATTHCPDVVSYRSIELNVLLGFLPPITSVTSGCLGYASSYAESSMQ
jgi:hypothetical protein